MKCNHLACCAAVVFAASIMSLAGVGSAIAESPKPTNTKPTNTKPPSTSMTSVFQQGGKDTKGHQVLTRVYKDQGGNLHYHAWDQTSNTWTWGHATKNVLVKNEGGPTTQGYNNPYTYDAPYKPTDKRLKDIEPGPSGSRRVKGAIISDR